MMKQRTSLTYLFTLMLTAVGISLVTFGIIRPTIRTINEISEIIATEEHELALRAAAGETIETTRTILTEVRATLPALEATLIDSVHPIELIQQLENLDRRHRIKALLDLIPNPTRADILPFTLQLQGNFTSLGYYLHDLEKLPWYITIDSLDIKTLNRPPTNVEANLIMTGHLSKKLPTSPAVPTPAL